MYLDKLLNLRIQPLFNIQMKELAIVKSCRAGHVTLRHVIMSALPNDDISLNMYMCINCTTMEVKILIEKSEIYWVYIIIIIHSVHFCVISDWLKIRVYQKLLRGQFTSRLITCCIQQIHYVMKPLSYYEASFVSIYRRGIPC